jgi:tetratricopeptide (TPR) repeat protein
VQTTAFKKLDDFERAEFLAATRQFDRAIELYMKILSDDQRARRQVFRWERAAQRALNLAIRVKNDPKLAETIAKKVLATPGVASFLKSDAETWLRVVREWKKNPNPKDPVKASALLIREGRRQAEYFGDTAALVHYLRATSLLHAEVRKDKSKNIGLAYYFLGLSYDALQWEGFQMASYQYYKACIETKPHSKLAMRCYRQLEKGVFSGVSNLLGNDIPETVDQELSSLYQKARIK